MLEFIGTVAVCAVALPVARYLWNFWQYRKSINAVEVLAAAVKAKADFVSSSAGYDAAEKVHVIAVCLKSVADSLSYGKIANSLIAGTQLQVLESMIASPDDIAFFMDKPENSITEVRLGLVRARESFVLLHQTMGSRPMA
ncbi:hypothetical protein [Xanthomonas campestris]|uniref:hypothetical protein n=1 Tax=Xanthomonas TaxID=338 RepID=UPI000E0E60DF|nr:hypothetical protein [Xanthomonas campestris]MCC5088634.1 hypothetical protein [Xanthomonas campestris]